MYPNNARICDMSMIVRSNFATDRNINITPRTHNAIGNVHTDTNEEYCRKTLKTKKKQTKFNIYLICKVDSK